LARVLDYIENSRQFIARVFVPRVTLSAENYVRGRKAFNVLRADILEWLSHHAEVGFDPLQGAANFARARAGAFDSIVND
jgi:hypothetical protein